MMNNVVIFTGEDDFRMQEEIRTYKSLFLQKYPQGDIQTLNNENTFLDLRNSVYTPNLFGEKRLICTENFWTPEIFETAQKTDFFTHLQQMSETCTLFIQEPKFDKRLKSTQFFLGSKGRTPLGKIKTFDPLDESQTITWAQKYAETQEGVLDYKTSSYLIEKCGTNLWHVSQEIKKLCLYTDKKPISTHHIDELCFTHPNAVIWDFLSALSDQNQAKALHHFQSLLESKVSPHEILPMIIREIRIHTQIKDGLMQNLSSKEIAQEAGLHPFVVQKTMPSSKKFSLPFLLFLYDQLFILDSQIKTGKIQTSQGNNSSLEFAIEKFILYTCQSIPINQ